MQKVFEKIKQFIYKEIDRTSSFVEHDTQCNILHFVEGLEEEYNNGWIPCSERLPEENINPVTRDYYSYKVTVKFGDVLDVRDYKFGNGHWHCGFQIMDDYVIAWKPKPEPYQSKENEK